MAQGSEGRNQFLDSFVVGTERVFAEHSSLRLIIQLQVNPVNGVVTLSFFCLANEFASEACPGCLRRSFDRLVDLKIVTDPLDEATLLHAIEDAPIAIDVVILKIK